TYIHISLIKGESEFRLIIDNDGDLIPQHMRESIFQPFVRLDSHSGVPGTGIGLPLARRLAAIHSGSLEIDTQAGCNRFIVTIPLNLPTQECSEIAFDTNSAAPACESDTASDTQNETVLIVEDKDDVRAFIAGCLRQVCNVIEASDGAEALSILNDSESTVQVSAIVSDVSMPHIDGLELTRRVKSDPDLNHIPVLLLTAQPDLQSNIDGINAGADAYVPKPFSPTLLRTMVTNMLESRRRLKKAFAGNPELAEVEAEANPSDQLFIRQLNEAVNQNLDDETFDLDALSSLMNMSRSSLNRKIKYYTDMTPNDYIRFYRLTKAAELLKSRQYRVNEVCFMVGFKTPSYFAKLFLKQFGISPSAYK
ncbi:MAG: response regulator, partial [Muribaculaceae bacterium]|nr:response regulator [Muribaculaceae bacterium]